jgi:hypothetical protein
VAVAIITFAAVAICASTILLAGFLWRRGGEDSVVRLSSVRGALRFLGGPFPLSMALHIALLLFLIITIHESRGRDLTILTMEPGGGGGAGDEMRDLELPPETMPEVAPVSATVPDFASSANAIRTATEYVRAATGGIGVGIGSGTGSGRGHGFGPGFGGFLMDLRRNGLDVVLVIDGTGSMKLIIDDVKSRMRRLVGAIHNLVPTARIGIVVYGATGEPVAMQPLTLSPAKLESFLAGLDARGGGEWEENVLGGVRAAIEKMDWRAPANKVIVLVADSPPPKADFAQLRALAARFHRANGALNAIDLSALEHQRFEAEFNRRIHRDPAGATTATTSMPGFYRQTQLAYQVIVRAGGGEMRALISDEQIGQEVMVLAFGERWRSTIAPFSRSIAPPGGR